MQSCLKRGQMQSKRGQPVIMSHVLQKGPFTNSKDLNSKDLPEGHFLHVLYEDM